VSSPIHLFYLINLIAIIGVSVFFSSLFGYMNFLSETNLLICMYIKFVAYLR